MLNIRYCNIIAVYFIFSEKKLTLYYDLKNKIEHPNLIIPILNIFLIRFCLLRMLNDK